MFLIPLSRLFQCFPQWTGCLSLARLRGHWTFHPWHLQSNIWESFLLLPDLLRQQGREASRSAPGLFFPPPLFKHTTLRNRHKPGKATKASEMFVGWHWLLCQNWGKFSCLTRCSCSVSLWKTSEPLGTSQTFHAWSGADIACDPCLYQRWQAKEWEPRSVWWQDLQQS